MVDPAVTEARLSVHEQVCAERYADIKEAFKAVNERLDKVVYSIIGLLIAMVAWLLVNGVPWK